MGHQDTSPTFTTAVSDVFLSSTHVRIMPNTVLPNAGEAEVLALFHEIATRIEATGTVNHTPCRNCVLRDVGLNSGQQPCKSETDDIPDEDYILLGVCSNCLRANTWDSCCWKQHSHVYNGRVGMQQ